MLGVWGARVLARPTKAPEALLPPRASLELPWRRASVGTVRSLEAGPVALDFRSAKPSEVAACHAALRLTRKTPALCAFDKRPALRRFSLVWYKRWEGIRTNCRLATVRLCPTGSWVRNRTVERNRIKCLFPPTKELKPISFTAMLYYWTGSYFGRSRDISFFNDVLSAGDNMEREKLHCARPRTMRNVPTLKPGSWQPHEDSASAEE